MFLSNENSIFTYVQGLQAFQQSLEVALQRAELRMVRWMCGVKLQDRVPSKELRGRLELEDIISVLQRNRSGGYQAKR